MAKTRITDAGHDVLKRISDKTIRNQVGCWHWIGASSQDGYAKIFWNGRMENVTRVLHKVSNGAIPPKMFMLHSCDNPGCVNPSHIRLGTNSENQKDRFRRHREREAANRRKESCPMGHKLFGHNIYLTHGETGRSCRICRNRRSSSWRENARAKREAKRG